jgi:hypothetical protein
MSAAITVLNRCLRSISSVIFLSVWWVFKRTSVWISLRLLKEPIENDEPFKNLLTQGMVLKDGAKMSKSKGNTVDPQEMIAKYGADTVRLFISALHIISDFSECLVGFQANICLDIIKIT